MPPLQVLVESLLRHSRLPGYPCGRHGCRGIQMHRFGILLHQLRRGGVHGTPTGDFPFPLPSESLLAYPDAPLHQILMVEQQVLFQSGIGRPAGVGNLRHRDIRVTLQEPDGLSILFLAGAARAARQPVTDTQPIAHLLAPFDYLGVVRTRLPAQIRAFQPEFTCNPICSMLPHASMVSLYLTRVAGNCPRSCPNLICPASSLLHSIA